MKISGVICTKPIYYYKGWHFEYHKYLGPWPLKKNLDPRKRAGDVFWGVFSEFDKLDDDSKEAFRIGGGCEFF